MTARDRFRADVAEALTDWRLGIPRVSVDAHAEIVRSGIAEILELRLRLAYLPIFQTLQRIEDRLASLK